MRQERDAELLSWEASSMGSIVRKLKKNQLFYYLPDLMPKNMSSAIPVPFFGNNLKPTIKALPKLVKVTDATVIPVSISYTKSGYVIKFYSCWENYPTNNLENDVTRMNKFFEQAICLDLEGYRWGNSL